MYTRYHDPEIFVQTLDGIDRSNHIVATYLMDDELPGEEFMDHFALIQSVAVEGSTGTWEKVAEETEEVRRRLSGKMVGYYEIPTNNASRKSAVVQLAFPIDAWIDNVPMMLLSIAGNCFAYSPKMRLLDVFIPDDLLAKFKGPKFGVPGIRKALNVPDRPLSLHIIKPKMGMTPKQVGDQCYQTALGGVDMMKDDEMTSDLYNSNYEDRLKAVLEAQEKAEAKTGKRTIYFVSITDEPRRIFEKAARAVESGARGLLVCYSAGLPVIRQLAEDPAINVPILAHMDLAGAYFMSPYQGISSPIIFGKISRLCGADAIVLPFSLGGKAMYMHDRFMSTTRNLTYPFGNLKPTMPMPSGGITPANVPDIVNTLGKDIMIGSGGGIHAHPKGPRAGARALRQAIDAAVKGIKLEEYAKEHEELGIALGVWGKKTDFKI